MSDLNPRLPSELDTRDWFVVTDGIGQKVASVYFPHETARSTATRLSAKTTRGGSRLTWQSCWNYCVDDNRVDRKGLIQRRLPRLQDFDLAQSSHAEMS
jgi:hypothetical protein